MGTDGKGVTTLVGFSGCPLRCKYCLNPQCFEEKAKAEKLTPNELYKKLLPDDLYFRATGGGVTFGGGEPLLYPDFIREFSDIVKGRWKIALETSLNVDEKSLVDADEYFVDVKDMNPEIYKRYTGKDNTPVISNLALLLKRAGSERVTVRLPLIEGFNTEADREKSEAILRQMGVVNFDKFTYRT